MAVVQLDPRLAELVDADVAVERIATGCHFTEGPVWSSSERCLVFSDIFVSTMHRWTEQDGDQVFRRPSFQANGNTRDVQGRLISCEHQGRRLSRTLEDGTVETLVATYDGKRFCSPNDVVGTAAGDLIFTDPTFGLRLPDGAVIGQEIPFAGVYRVSPDGNVTLLADDFAAPNGLVVSDDQSKLYIDDTRHSHVRVFDLGTGGLSNGRVFCEVKRGESVGRPDGMKLDSRGNLYVTANTDEGIWVYAPDGSLLGTIGLPERPANCAWGGDDWQTLFVTAQSSVYRLRMKVAGQKVIGQ